MYFDFLRNVKARGGWLLWVDGQWMSFEGQRLEIVAHRGPWSSKVNIESKGEESLEGLIF